jgi:hypothetical protein
MQIEAHSGSGRILYDVGADGTVNRSADDAQATLMGGGPVVTASTLNGAILFFRGSLRDYPQFERLMEPKLREGQPPQGPPR